MGREDKIALISRNEQAVTLLFKLLMGEEEPDAGHHQVGRLHHAGLYAARTTARISTAASSP